MRARLYNTSLARAALPVANRTDGTVAGTTIDLADPTGGQDTFTTALLVVIAGAITDGTHTVTIEESDNDSDWDPAPAAVISGGPVAFDTDDDNAVAELGYDGTKRYIRASIAVADSTIGGAVGAVAVLGGNTSRPVKR